MYAHHIQYFLYFDFFFRPVYGQRKGYHFNSVSLIILPEMSCFVQPKQQKPKDIKQRKTARPHIGEAATREFLTLLAKKGFERL